MNSIVCRGIFLFFGVIMTCVGAYAETVLNVAENGWENGISVRREVFGVNQLHYGKDSYGFLLPNTKKVQPELVEMLRELGIRSMRYPGGCGGTHTYDWKRSAGLKGWYHGLGLIEFLRVCEEIGAEPVLGISAFRGSPEEAAEFVEFLNAPNDGEHKWAAVRAELGHPEPYGVRYVEYGNESYHGNHSVQPNEMVTPKEYGENYLKFRSAMKAVDPKIELGVVLEKTYWNRGVLETVGENFDFGIVHYYQKVRPTDVAEYAQNFAMMDGLEKQKAEVLKSVPEEKRAKMKFALTEFNANYTQHKHLTAALVNAEAIFFLCQNPEYFVAHYWQFVNEGFGMVRGETGNFVKRPNALMFELASRHLQDYVLPVTLEGRMVENPQSVSLHTVDGETFPGTVTGTEEKDNKAGNEVEDAENTKRDLTPEDMEKNLLEKLHWKGTDREDRSRMEVLPDGTLKVDFVTDEPYNFYHVSTWLAVPEWNAVVFRLTAEARVEGMENSSGGALELGDGRGFTKTRSVAQTESVLSEKWTPISVDYYPLKDTKSLELKVRRMAGGGKGTMYFRNIQITPVLPTPIMKSVISALASVSDDENRLSVLMINRSWEPETVTFYPENCVKGRNLDLRNVTAETLTGDGPFADNEGETPGVRIMPISVEIVKDMETKKGKTAIKVTIPPHSLVGVTAEIN